MNTFGNNVAVKPVELSVTKSNAAKGFATADQKMQLIPTEVVFATEDGRFQPGDKVWLRGEVITSLGAKSVYKIDDWVFIIVQQNDVMCANREVVNDNYEYTALKSILSNYTTCTGDGK